MNWIGLINKLDVIRMRKVETWRCIDDGTGRNLFYISNFQARTRHEPEDFIPEYFENGDRKYYHRGYCIRCRKSGPPCVLSKETGRHAFAFNMCEDCIKNTAMVTKLFLNGDKAWAANEGFPKNFFVDLEKQAMSETRDADLQSRAEEALYHVLKLAKARRDVVRINFCRVKAEPYGLKLGTYMSWGFGSQYDEYFGEVNEKNQMHGIGVKFYSDGTVYFGPWVNGYQKTEVKGLWIRPNGATYEGQWLQGRKHGLGKQIYSDDTVYTGQFANGFEHGQGVRTYSDGSVFEGRFRFGRRDGPGTLKLPNGKIQKGNFRDALVNTEKPPPPVYEGDKEVDLIGQEIIYNPDSLLNICLEKLGVSMVANKKLFSSKLVERRVSMHLKPLIAISIMRQLTRISPDFMNSVKFIAYKKLDTVSINNVHMKLEDMEALISFVESNSVLKCLKLTTDRIESAAFVSLGNKLMTNCWTCLESLDLSFNPMDTPAITMIAKGISCVSSLTHVKLSGCKINYAGAYIIGSVLANDTHLKDLDLSFNILGAGGGESIGEALVRNTCLTHLNLRSNNLGPIGGLAVVNGMQRNLSLKVVCLVDNKIGNEVAEMLAARCHGSTQELCSSFRTGELALPPKYKKEIYGEMTCYRMPSVS